MALCAFHTARASCQVTEDFSSEEGGIRKLSWAGGFEGNAHHSVHQDVLSTCDLQSIILAKTDKISGFVGFVERL